MLQNLEIEWEDNSPRSNVIEILNLCQNLQVLRVSYCPSKGSGLLNRITEIVSERSFAIGFTQELLQTLGPQIHLKELTLTMDLKSAQTWLVFQDLFRGLPPAAVPQTEFPMKLEVLKLSFPILFNDS